jgi:predicted permease
MDKMLLMPIPVTAPSEIVQVQFRDARPNADHPLQAISYAEFRDLPRSLSSVSGLAYQRRQGALAVLNGHRELLWASLVSENYFKVLGVAIQPGIGFSQDRPNLIISHGLWMREFGGRPDVIGQIMPIYGQSFAIGGVAAPDFVGTDTIFPSDLWIPVETWLQLQPEFRTMIERRDDQGGIIWGRLRAGVQPEQASAEIESVVRSEPSQNSPVLDRHLVGYAYAEFTERETGNKIVTAIGVLMLGILLAVACANVAGILLAQAEERRQETAVRQALGATRARLVRASLVESIVLSLFAAAIGLACARTLMNLLPILLPSLPIPVHFEFSIGPRVWIYVISLVCVSALFFGLIPAWRGSRPDLLSGLRRDFAVSILRAHIPIRSILIVAQVAAAEVLLFSAGLIFDSLSTLRRVDPGFDPSRPVAIATLVPTTEDGGAIQVDCEAIRERLARIAGVRRVAYGQTVPLSGTQGPTLRLEVSGEEPREILGGMAGPAFFSTLGVPILSGRDLQVSDRQAVLVNATLARQMDPTGNIVGREIRLDGAIREVVGVFRDTATSSVRDPVRPRAITLAPSRSGGDTTFAIEVIGHPAGYVALLSSELAAAQPGSTVMNSKTLRQHFEGSFFAERTATKAFYVLGLLSLLLTATGLYGISTALFARRSKEFAIRLALGAAPHQIMGLVLRGALVLTASGLVLGLAIGIPAALLIASKVPGFSTWSVPALVLSSVIVIAATIAAAAQPVHRVLRIQPSDVLRSE